MTTRGAVLAVIPARGGSKGLPGKNIRPLRGIPLIAHSLRCAALSKEIDLTIVSTDSPEIAAVATAHGGTVPFLRPAELAADDTPMMPVITHALEQVERSTGRTFESVVLLDPTSPGRLPEEIDRAVHLLATDPVAQGVVACSKPTFNPLWVGVFEENGYLKPAFELRGGQFQRRQDVPPFFRINGALYVWRASFVRGGPVAWREHPHRMIEMPEARALSIDDLYEFELAELLLTHGQVKLPWLEPTR